MTSLEAMALEVDLKTVMEQKFESAGSVKFMAERLIKDERPELVNCRIAYLFRDGDWESNGKTVLGKTYKVSPMHQALIPYDMLIVVNHKFWVLGAPAQREALIFHELAHIEPTDDGYALIHHDVQEFASVVRRYGLWDADLRMMDMARQEYEQANLPGVATP